MSTWVILGLDIFSLVWVLLIWTSANYRSGSLNTISHYLVSDPVAKTQFVYWLILYIGREILIALPTMEIERGVITRVKAGVGYIKNMGYVDPRTGNMRYPKAKMESILSLIVLYLAMSIRVVFLIAVVTFPVDIHKDAHYIAVGMVIGASLVISTINLNERHGGEWSDGNNSRIMEFVTQIDYIVTVMHILSAIALYFHVFTAIFEMILLISIILDHMFTAVDFHHHPKNVYMSKLE